MVHDVVVARDVLTLVLNVVVVLRLVVQLVVVALDVDQVVVVV